MKILGHRGTGVTMRNSKAQERARRDEGTRGPENTLKAFELALCGGADGLELDVIRTADGDLAVIHDNALNLHIEGANRKKRDLGYANQHTMYELKQMNAGDGEPIPSLRDVFSHAAGYGNPVLNIELRGKNTYRLTYKQALQSGYPMDRVVFSSFDHDELAKLRALDKDINIGLLFPMQIKIGNKIVTRPAFSKRYIDNVIEKVKPTSIHPLLKDLRQEMIDYAKSKGLEIYAWTRKEKHPDSDSTVYDFAKKHRHDPDIHLITDYPSEIKAKLDIFS